MLLDRHLKHSERKKVGGAEKGNLFLECTQIIQWILKS